MRKLFFASLCLLSFHVAAQKILWQKGAMVTINKEVIVGELLIHLSEDVVVIRQDTIAKVLSAATISSFRVYDEQADINRKFISLPDEKSNGRKKIYEVVFYGTIPVIRKSRRDLDPQNDAEYIYYFVQDGVAKALKKFRTSLYPDLRNQLAMEEKLYHLNPNDMADAIRFIELYNQSHAVLALR